MRSPAIVFSLMAATALSPTFVVGTPLPPVHSDVSTTDHHSPNTNSPRGLGFLNEIFTRAEPIPPRGNAPRVIALSGISFRRKRFWERDGSESVERRSDEDGHSKEHHNDLSKGHRKDQPKHSQQKLDILPKRHDDSHTTGGNAHTGSSGDVSGGSVDSGDSHPQHKSNVLLGKRLDDSQTSGGNAHTGKSGDVSGGSVDSGDNSGAPLGTIMNVNSNNAGTGGGSTTGCAAGGKGESGGNASSGDSGRAEGGHVKGSGAMINMDSNNAGNAGHSSTGCAEAGYSEGAGDNSQASTDAKPQSGP